MESIDEAAIIKQLQKENRILKKRLERSELDRSKLEETNRNKTSLLKQVICEFQESQGILEQKSKALEQAIEHLKLAQSQLVEIEKLNALGTLVAGVAHEINTPVGTGITLASTLADETEALIAAVAEGGLLRSQFNGYLETAQEVTRLLVSNLNRAGALVQSFKQVAVDQASLERRTFNVKEYCQEIVTSLSPKLKRTLHSFELSGDPNILIDSYPGAFAQIITNLITNSLTHAYPKAEAQGTLCLHISQQDSLLIVQYEDNGCGIPRANIDKIFEPFYTTARHRGGTGLGLHIIYNLVTQTLGGNIQVKSKTEQGTRFTISLPLKVASNL
ncbi:MAG: HAMP domain-containing histidine kinase [Acaryochloridaceae cyanobacterium SU_2_1]|nr:HAMP domain-containing histidine kinase [Acaryochloridaceae cyanobacterium SU_2_1]